MLTLLMQQITGFDFVYSVHWRVKSKKPRAALVDVSFNSMLNYFLKVQDLTKENITGALYLNVTV